MIRLILLLSAWTNFYVIVGSSAGALTGLQFVVIALISQVKATGSMRDIRAFGTPTVVHFCVCLLISATMTAPWHSLDHLAFCVGAFGIAGILYSMRVLWHARKAEYNPDAEDWFWYTALPLAAYTALAVAAATVWWWAPRIGLSVIAATSLLFLFLGIHNAWDTVTYIAVQNQENPDSPATTPRS